MLLWCNGDWFSRTNHHSRWGKAAETKVPKFSGNYKNSEIYESTTTLLGVLKLLSQLHSKAFGETCAVFQNVDKNEKILVTPDLLEQFTSINKALDRWCELAFKQPLRNKQIALLTDASFLAAGYAVLIEDDPLEKYTSTRKAFAPVAYGSKRPQDL